MGTLCVVDDKPRHPTGDDIRILQSAALLVETLLDERCAVRAAKRVADERQFALDKLDRTYRQFRQAERMADIGSWRMKLADNQVEWSDQTYAIHRLPAGDGPPLDTALNVYPGQPPIGRDRDRMRTAIPVGSMDPFRRQFNPPPSFRDRCRGRYSLRTTITAVVGMAAGRPAPPDLMRECLRFDRTADQSAPTAKYSECRFSDPNDVGKNNRHRRWHEEQEMKLFNQKIATDFIVAIGALLRNPLIAKPVQGEITVMFLAGPRSKGEFLLVPASPADERDLDAVLLEFDPGKEREGPKNVIVIARNHDGVKQTWHNCALWAITDNGPLMIIPKGEDFFFGFDGSSLVTHEGRPTPIELGKGFAIARRLIKRGARIAGKIKMMQRAND